MLYEVKRRATRNNQFNEHVPLAELQLKISLRASSLLLLCVLFYVRVDGNATPQRRERKKHFRPDTPLVIELSSRRRRHLVCHFRKGDDDDAHVVG